MCVALALLASVFAAFMIVRGMMWHRTRSDFRRMKRKMAEIEAEVLK
ncbi:MAG: hypothetical protein PUE71_07790 [Clostridia bacterium]|nr:hypothetical protein [Clostridia bacterium]